MRRAIVAVPLIAAGIAATGANANIEVSASACTPLKAIYAEKNWRDSTPKNGRSICQTANPRKARNTVSHFRLYRRFRLAAPYPGLREGDPWLEWLAVPAYIVRCETRGYYGSGRWLASNGSALGPYQLLGWGAPYPARSPEAKVRNHEIASRLSLSNWACR